MDIIITAPTSHAVFIVYVKIYFEKLFLTYNNNFGSEPHGA